IQFDYPMLMVATKSDKLKKSQIKRAVESLIREYQLPVPPVIISSLKKTGRTEVLAQLGEILQ
ncbi:YihA family ribosome biogenesis GTP-binding protein, partial [Fibrobacterota bacterium]